MIKENELLSLYKKELDYMLDECDWITSVSGEMVCDLVTSVLRKKYDVFINAKELFETYSVEVNKLGLTNKEWQEQYGIQEIISIIYKILNK